jgi:hypothetical protein
VCFNRDVGATPARRTTALHARRAYRFLPCFSARRALDEPTRARIAGVSHDVGPVTHSLSFWPIGDSVDARHAERRKTGIRVFPCMGIACDAVTQCFQLRPDMQRRRSRVAVGAEPYFAARQQISVKRYRLLLARGPTPCRICARQIPSGALATCT